ncbi:methylenetetrahydrofolate reductase [Parasphingopyxis marina]|uniref:Methylenetetrahydrofolate reductase n=1 Tax=Parasphingopyxis marina TaxID=2761622 RepID=A0A842I0N5_9SPHN|nr:methylenetetrahydrofolate reductase [Parasphingopyxis marina]MBC2778407.1 methylenetetrahydrofolate reductase [Parasphingopyxis marina]
MDTLTMARPAEAEAKTRIARLASSCSYEISARDFAGLDLARPALPPGTMVAIIWTPRDSDDERVAMARALTDAGYRPFPHIGARHFESDAALDRLLGRLADEAGVTRAFVIGGDCQRRGPLSSGYDALATGHFARHRFREIGLPGYPEGHPRIAAPVLVGDMKAKLALVRAAGMKPLVLTQFAFHAEPIADWLGDVRRDEPDLPIRIGLAGPATVRTLLRYAALCGVEASRRGRKTLGSSLIKLLGETGPDPVIRALAERPEALEAGPTDLHIFPFGGLAKSAKWVNALADGKFAMAARGAGLKFTG